MKKRDNSFAIASGSLSGRKCPDPAKLLLNQESDAKRVKQKLLELQDRLNRGRSKLATEGSEAEQEWKRAPQQDGPTGEGSSIARLLGCL